ncbi:MAG: ATP-binding protein, partial [Candidatus Riflebacteria bacterium]|nr:ATP-binding protein [Candidatus Riflebacteria bacterium]
LLTGSRQVGKSTLLKHLMKPSRIYITLDDLEERKLAKNDPAMFFQIHSLPIFIDEVQYAPELFSYIKIAVDNGAKPGSFWLTGSQSFSLMELAQESLAGRTAILHLPAISQHELYGKKDNIPFTIDLDSLKQRKSLYKPASLKEIYERIWKGSLPALLSGKYSDNNIYYSSYVQTYINRDVLDIAKVDKLLFSDFIKSAACRTAQMLNIHDIARDVGISDDTAKRWLKILEQSDIIYFLRPYSNNLLKRTIKTPKLYFFDTGLVAYLTSHTTPELLANGAINGAILENYIVSEIRKTYFNNGQNCPMWYYRDKNNKEIDIIIETDGELHPLEIKRSANPASKLINTFSVLNRSSVSKGKGAVICMKEELSAFNSDNFIIPVWMI